MLASCASPGATDTSETGTGTEMSVVESTRCASEPAVAPPPTDIGLTIRGVVDALGVGEPIDSTDYNFSGVLTDGTGMPLFTDYEGVPGQWRVDVTSPHEVRISTVGTGDLLPASLVRYLAKTLHESPDSDNELREVDIRDEGDKRIEQYVYGRVAVLVETEPQTLPTGEVGPSVQITIRPDTVPDVQPALHLKD